MGCASGDLNDDGWIDIVISHRKGVLALINKEGIFEKKSLWETSNGWPTSVSLGDVDADGKLDIYVSNYLSYKKLGKTFEAQSGYIHNNSRAFNPALYLGQPNKLFINEGNLIFSEKASKFNVENSDGRTLSATFLNINNDEHPDLIINNDSGSPSQILLNHKGIKFEPLDSNLEIAFNNRSTIHLENNHGFQEYILSGEYGRIPTISESIPLKDRSRLAISDTNSSLIDNTFGSVGADINNDGLLDIIFANGFSNPDTDSPENTQGQINTALIRTPKNTFDHYIFNEGASLSSRGIVRVDVDNDGDHDILLTNNNGPLQLWVNNRPSQNWIGMSLDSNFASAEVTTNFRILRRHKPTDSFLSSSDPRISIQLEEQEAVHSIKLSFLNKAPVTYHNPEHNRYLELGITEKITTQSHADNYSIKVPKEIKNKKNKITKFRLLDISQKIEELEIIKERKDFTKLRTIKIALNDKTLEVRTASIETLRTLETEIGIHWLIDRLDISKDPDEICAIADAFFHFYSEEEACRQNKGLAIPKLSHLAMSHAQNDVRLCTLRALSETRSTRAALTAEAILYQSPPEEIELAAHRILKKIRRTNNTHDSDLRRSPSVNTLN